MPSLDGTKVAQKETRESSFVLQRHPELLLRHQGRRELKAPQQQQLASALAELSQPRKKMPLFQRTQTIMAELLRARERRKKKSLSLPLLAFNRRSKSSDCTQIVEHAVKNRVHIHT